MTEFAHWKMNDNAASVVVEDSGTGNYNGTLNGGNNTEDITVAGKVNAAFNLDGSADCINLAAHIANLVYNTPASFSFWFYALDDHKTVGSNLLQISDSGTHPNLNEFMIYYGKCTSGLTDEVITIWAASDYSGNYSVFGFTDSGSWISGWHHVLVTADGSNWVLYIDGISRSLTDGGPTTAYKGDYGEVIGTPTRMYLGARDYGIGLGSFFRGRIDDFRIYDYVLTEREISYLYNSGNGREDSLIEFPVIIETAHYKLNDSENNTTVVEETGRFSGSLKGGDNTEDLSVSGKINEALDLDGSADYVEITHDTELDYGIGDFSVCAWINLDQLASEIVNDVVILAKRTDGSNEWRLYFNAQDKITFVAWDGGVQDTYLRDNSASISSSSVWYHITAVLDRDNEGRLYVDGSEISSYQSQNIGTGSVSNSANLLIGKRGPDALYLNGRVDDVRIYNFALSQDQIDFIYSSGSGSEGSLSASNGDPAIAHYKLNDNLANTVVSDSSGNSYSGSLAGGNNTEDLSTTGKINEALNLDGSADYIDLDNHASNLIFSVSASFSFWVKADFDHKTTPGTVFHATDGAAFNTAEYFIIQYGSITAGLTDELITIGAGSGTDHTCYGYEDSGTYTGEWLHVVVGCNGSIWKLYINSEEKSLADAGFSSQDYKGKYGAHISSKNVVNIGRQYFGSAARWFDGIIDDFRIFDYVLSGDQIAYLYNAGAGTEEALPTSVDIDPPILQNQNPSSGSIEIPISSSVYYELRDSGSIGLADHAFWLDYGDGAGYILGYASGSWQNSHTGSVVQSGSGALDITVQPTGNYGYGDTVQARVFAYDQENNELDYSWSFDIIEDLTNPYVLGRNPSSGSIGVNITSSVAFRWDDSESGVDPDKVHHWIDYGDLSYVLVYSSGSWQNGHTGSITSQGNGFIYDIEPTGAFAYEADIRVKTQAEDIESNQDIQIWGFQTEINLDPVVPVVQNQNPASGATGVEFDSNVYLEVYDSGSGINLSTVTIEIDRDEGTGYEFVYSGSAYQAGFAGTDITPDSGNTYQFDIDPDSDFFYSQNVLVRVDATDVSGNIMPTKEYSFGTLTDTIDPVLQNLNPASGSTNVSLNRNVYLEIYDNQSQVDLSTVTVEIDFNIGGGYEFAYSGSTYQAGFAGTVISGSGDTYKFNINPNANFSYSKQIFVRVNSKDRVGNIMPTETYSFFSIEDNDVPVVQNQSPSQGQSIIPSRSIYFEVYDAVSGVDISSVTIEMDKSGGLGYEMVYSGSAYQAGFDGTVDIGINGKKYEFLLTPDISLDIGRKIYMRINATDNGSNSGQTIYFFYIIRKFSKRRRAGGTSIKIEKSKPSSKEFLNIFLRGRR